MVETKCIRVDNAQSAANSETKLTREQWKALIALHRTLLHEHHDFFLATQHPAASPALRRLASKYAMPARMWRHGIHSFLELLRQQLPDSHEHMLAFIYLAYDMMALLYETVPAFEDTWIECLGDLGRYRMAIEDGDIRDREVWTGVARQWYKCASEKAPTTGRLYHHLAILARPNPAPQLHHSPRPPLIILPSTAQGDTLLVLPENAFARAHAHLLCRKSRVPTKVTLIDPPSKTSRHFLPSGDDLELRCGEMNMPQLFHHILVFMLCYLEDNFTEFISWGKSTALLNTITKSLEYNFYSDLRHTIYRPLPEDLAMRGLTHTEDYLPISWFTFKLTDEDENHLELPPAVYQSFERMPWLVPYLSCYTFCCWSAFWGGELWATNKDPDLGIKRGINVMVE